MESLQANMNKAAYEARSVVMSLQTRREVLQSTIRTNVTRQNLIKSAVQSMSQVIQGFKISGAAMASDFVRSHVTKAKQMQQQMQQLQREKMQADQELSAVERNIIESKGRAEGLMQALAFAKAS